MFDLTVQLGYAYTHQFCISNICLHVRLPKYAIAIIFNFPTQYLTHRFSVETTTIVRRLPSNATHIAVRSFDFARDMPNGTDLNQFMHDNVAVVNIEYYSPEYTAISEPQNGLARPNRRVEWTLALICWHELA